MNFIGLIIGAVSFAIIGVFHPLVIKGYYYLGIKSWKIFLLIGVICCVASCFFDSLYVSISLGIIGFSCLWSVQEIFDQRKRVQQGRFPGNPKLKGAFDIYPEKESEYNAIRNLNIRAFDGLGEAFLIEKLRASKEFIPALSLVAVKNDILVGHILFSKMNIKKDNGEEYTSLAMAPLAVLPEFQQHGIGAELVKEGLATAKILGFKSVVVIGHADYYSKFGFQKASAFGLKYVMEIPDECFMAIEFETGTLLPGTTVYPEAFNIF